MFDKINNYKKRRRLQNRERVGAINWSFKNILLFGLRRTRTRWNVSLVESEPNVKTKSMKFPHYLLYENNPTICGLAKRIPLSSYEKKKTLWLSIDKNFWAARSLKYLSLFILVYIVEPVRTGYETVSPDVGPGKVCACLVLQSRSLQEIGPKTIYSMIFQKLVDALWQNLVNELGWWQEQADSILVTVRMRISPFSEIFCC